MALETSKKTIEVETLIGAQYSQALIRAETLVPGAGREAIEPLLSEASLSVTGADVQTDRVVLDGTAYCQAVYRQGEETTLRALTAQATLSQVIEVSGAAPGMLVRVNAQVEHVESKYENGHMVFLITCGLRAQVLQLRQTELIDAISGVEDIQTVYGEIRSCKLAADTDADVLVKGEIALPVALDARTSLMDWGAAAIESAEAELGGLRVKGKVMVESLISSGVVGRPAALIKYPLEFDRLMELPDWLMKDAHASVSLGRIQSQVDQKEGGEDALLNLQLYLHAKSVVHIPDHTYVYRVHERSAMANIGMYSQAHQPMLHSMSAILTREGVKEFYFRDFLQSCVWVDEKETGIFACMKRFNAHIRPLVLDGVQEERIPQWDLRVYRAVVKGWFPQLYILLRVREKLTKRKWGIRR